MDNTNSVGLQRSSWHAVDEDVLASLYIRASILQRILQFFGSLLAAMLETDYHGLMVVNVSDFTMASGAEWKSKVN